MERSPEFESVRLRFPAYRHLLDAMLDYHQDLRQACQNYEECLFAIAHPDLEIFRDRFLTIGRLLEQEILEYLQEAAVEIDPTIFESNPATLS